MSELLIKVEGMSCNHCKTAVEKALNAVSGVERVQVNLDKKEVLVAGSAGRNDVVNAIKEAGYSVVE